MKRQLNKKQRGQIIKDMQRVPKLIVNFRMTPDEKDLLEQKAIEYTGGNITALVKYAVKRFNPSPNELVSLR